MRNMNLKLISLVFVILGFGFYNGLFAQCTATINTTPASGTSPNLNVAFSSVTMSNATAFTFNGGALPVGWTASPYTIGEPCYVDAPDNTPYFWATTRDVSGYRHVTTNPLDVTYGGQLFFEFRYGADDPNPGCEDPDEPAEGFYLQYSINGVDWVQIDYWEPDPSRTLRPELYVWNAYVRNIPVAAQTASTRFRWIQFSSSGDEFDNWGVDNVSVSATDVVTSWNWNVCGTTYTTSTFTNTFSTYGNCLVTLTTTTAGGCTANTSLTYTVNPPAPTGLSYSPNPVVAAINNQNVSSSPTVSGVVTGYTISPALPTGVTINATTGVISGIPTVATSQTDYTVTASNITGGTTATFTLTTVNAVAPTSLSYSPNPVVAIFGETTVLSSPTVVGGTTITYYTISSPLPAGLIFNTTTGVISGIPTSTIPLTSYTITAGNPAGSVTATFTLTVNYAAVPTLQANNVLISQIDYYSFQVDWTDGNGSKAAVFVKQTNTGEAAPVNTTTYNANSMFMSGSEIGTSDWYCVYNGTGNSVIVTSLLDNTEYRVMVVEYNGVANGQQYLVSTATGNPVNATTLDVPELLIDGNTTYGELNLSLLFSNLSTITDANPTNLLSAKAEITGNFLTTQDVLNINGTITGTDNGIAYEFVPATGVMTLTGSATQAVYQTVLRKLIYKNTSATPNKLTREITLSVVLANAPSIEIIDIIYILFDTELPTVNTQNITVELNSNGTVVINGEAVNNGSTDNYGISTYTVVPSTFGCEDLGENTVNLTVTDMLGNSSTSTAVVTVEDNINPVAIGQNITISLNAGGVATATASAVNNNSTDNCLIDVMTLSKYTFDGSNIGTNNVTFTVFDQSGNSNSVTVVITVIDEIDPVVVINTGGTYTIDKDGSVITLDPEVFDGGTTDNCDFVLSISPETIDCSNVGAPVTVTLTATDCAGNTNSQTTTITIVDNSKPILVCPEDQDIVAANGYTVVGDEFNLVSTDDNCSIQSVINDFNNAASLNGAFINVGLHTITWTAIDPSANSRTCSFDVTVLPTSISDLISKNINIFPNPSFDIFNIVGENIKNVKIYDITGKLIVEKATNGNSTQIDLSNSIIGIYFVELNLENEVLFTKIIKK